MKRALITGLALTAALALAACSSATNASSDAPASAAATTAEPSPGASATSVQPAEACALIAPADLAVILGKDPGTGVVTATGSCTYEAAPLQYTVAQARAYADMTGAIESELAKAGRDAASTPVKGAPNSAVAYDLGDGGFAVAARNGAWASIALGAASVEQLAAVDTALIATLDAKS